jgi:uncharacterized coiled-coil DUF342 family protein
MRKCLACGKEFNGNIAIGRHYKENPTHSPKYKGKKEKKGNQVTVVSASMQTVLHRIIENPNILTNEIDALMEQLKDKREQACNTIDQMDREIERLKTLKSTLNENGINLVKEIA